MYLAITYIINIMRKMENFIKMSRRKIWQNNRTGRQMPRGYFIGRIYI